jgi:diguanylate cyclase (GGDEF)-like protein
MKTESLFKRKVQLAFGFAMLTLLLMGVLSYRWMVLSDESDQWVRHSQEVLTNIQNLRLAMESLRSSSREFALTGKESDLDSFHANVIGVKQDQDNIRKLTADNPIQQNRLAALADLAAENIENSEAIIGLRRAQGLTVAATASLTGKSHKGADDFEALADKLQSEEMGLRKLRFAATERDLSQTKIILFTGTMLGLLITGIAGWSALRDSTMRTQAEAHLVQKVQELNRSNEELVRLADATRTMTRQMTHAAEHDTLTGLPNRLLLNDSIDRAITFAQRHEIQFAVLVLDLDGFKHINDSLGHPTGDKLLQSLAKRLVHCVRSTDTVSRQGGDEFVVLLSEIDHPQDAISMSRRLLDVVAGATSIEKHDLHITASIGVSIYPDDGRDAETLIKNADTAMFHAKEDGRQSFQFFRSAMNVQAVERQMIEEHLRRALERQEFTLHYQPKINIATGMVTGVEALIRWTHPTLGSISPGQFIPVAESCGLIAPIGDWVLREACTQAKVWADAGLPMMTMAVNVSASQFRNEGFLDDLFTILSETGLHPRYLELELTESVLMKRAELTASILSALREKGVRVAIDDFGTGYSSLSYLRKFPLDAIKIDQSFVGQITTVPDETVIVRAIISMGRSLNLRVIAEGVETQEQLDFLKAHRCDEAQGYFFSRPVPPQELVKFLETRLILSEELQR